MANDLAFDIIVSSFRKIIARKINKTRQNSWTYAVKKLLKINHENTKQDIEIKLAPFGRT